MIRNKDSPTISRLVLAAAASLLTATAAHATITDWGVHGTIEVGAQTHGPSSFMDIFSFTLPTADNLASTTVSNDLFTGGSSSLHISDGTVGLFQGIYGDATPDALKLLYSFNGTSGDTSHSLSGLGTGPYYYEVIGKADGAHGGFYTLTSTFTTMPVPEPETYGMFMAGLGLMGFIARKKNRSA